MRDGQVDAVVVSSLDRPARRARLMLELVDELEAHHVQLVSSRESLDSGTQAGRMVLTVLAAMAEFEREQVRARTHGAIEANDARRGERGGRQPFDYRPGARPGEIEVDEDAASAVRRIFTLHRRGKSLRAIVATLIAEGTPAPASSPDRPTQWHASSVRAILRH